MLKPYPHAVAGAFVALWALPAHSAPLAYVDLFSHGADLRYVAETTIPSPGKNQTIAVCHLTKTMRIYAIPVYTVTRGYALAVDACAAKTYQPLSDAHLADLVAAKFVEPGLPTSAQATLWQQIWGHAALIGGLGGIIFRALGALWGRRETDQDATHAAP